MKLRKYQSADCPVLAQLFYDTIHSVNARDYSKAQLNAWATGVVNLIAWDASFLKHNTIVAEQNGRIVGFGDMDDSGYLDKLFVHKECQGMGIAKAIVTALEQDEKMKRISCFTVHASITAKPFFEKMGYQVVRQNTVIRQGIQLTNFSMSKDGLK